MKHLLTIVAAFTLATGSSLSGAGAAVAQQPGAQAQTAQPGKEPAAAGPKAGKDAKKDRSNPLNLGTNNKEPIKIDSDRLDVFDRENKAVFTGSVVAVQGDSTMRCTVLTVFYEQRGKGAERAAGAQGDSIKQLDCTGPVTVVSKDQVATGDNATFDRVNNKVILTCNAALSQCQNVTRGERIVYDMNTGVANVETAPGGRVRALFVPGSDDQQKQACQLQAAGQAPAAQPAAPAVKPAAPPQTQPAAAQAAPRATQKQRAQVN
jgi:lipopolysaccharide export system protein LptA